MMAQSSLFNLEGKVSLITGAGSGLGRIFCEAMAENGSQVICSDVNETWAQETARTIATTTMKPMIVKADVSRQDEVRALFQVVERKYGRLDILINNAGIATKSAKIHEMRLEDWTKVINVNLTGTFLCMQEGLKLMLRQKGGSIINISSILGLVGADPDILAIPHYIASKHGIIGLTRIAAAEYGPSNIRINAIAPGFIGGTRLGDVEERTEAQTQAWSEKVVSLTPLKRLGRPAELKGLAVLLASDASSFISGAVYLIDGGWCAW
jgi:NAD(P)-dependent dehydrogenase (short-subunit alcohol dehydrogenase family)